MKNIKTFENFKQPKVGDYIIANVEYGAASIENFINNNIGRISSKYTGKNPEIAQKLKDYFRVYYNDIPEYVKNSYFFTDFTISIRKEQIIFSSPNKEDVIAYLNTKKYNL